MTDSADMDEGMRMNPEDAAVIMAEARDRARHEFRSSHRATFTIGGIGVLVGYGLLWLTTRSQQPYHGPVPGAFAAATLLFSTAAFATMVGNQSDSGLGGGSVLRRRISMLSLIGGLAAMFALEGALVQAGASRAVTGVFEAAVPILVAGLFYLSTSAVRRDWPAFALGAWLLAVAAGGGFAGPGTVWAVDALAAGLAFLLMAAIRPRLSRP